MPRFRAPLGGVGSQRTDDPRFVAPLIIGERHTAEFGSLKATIAGLQAQMKTMLDDKSDAINKFKALSEGLKGTLGDDWASKLPELAQYKEAFKTIQKLNGDINECTEQLAKQKEDDVFNKASLMEMQRQLALLQQELLKRQTQLNNIVGDPAVQGIVDAVTRAMNVETGEDPATITQNLRQAIANYDNNKTARKNAILDAKTVALASAGADKSDEEIERIILKDATDQSDLLCLEKLFILLNETERRPAVDEQLKQLVDEFGALLANLPFQIRTIFETVYRSKFTRIFAKYSEKYFNAAARGKEQANNYISGVVTPLYNFTLSIYFNFSTRYNRIINPSLDGDQQRIALVDLREYIRGRIAVFQREFPKVNLGPTLSTAAAAPPPLVPPPAETNAEHSMVTTLKMSSIHKFGRLKI